MQIHKSILTTENYLHYAMLLMPEEPLAGVLALATHGYTASKRDPLAWGQRLANAGIPSMVFDLPGHYLGGFFEVDSFETFTKIAERTYLSAYKYAKEQLQSVNKLFFIGHSLGGLLALKAMNLDEFSDIEKQAICIGLGLTPEKKKHAFESSFYQKTLRFREQLVSPVLNSDAVFPWIMDQKNHLEISNKRIHLLTGKDDVVVGANGAQVLKEKLEGMGNTVSLEEPNKMPHHEPTMAAPFVYSYIKSELGL